MSVMTRLVWRTRVCVCVCVRVSKRSAVVFIFDTYARPSSRRSTTIANVRHHVVGLHEVRVRI